MLKQTTNLKKFRFVVNVGVGVVDLLNAIAQDSLRRAVERSENDAARALARCVALSLRRVGSKQTGVAASHQLQKLVTKTTNTATTVTTATASALNSTFDNGRSLNSNDQNDVHDFACLLALLCLT